MCDDDRPITDPADAIVALADRIMELSGDMHGIAVELRGIAAQLRDTPAGPPAPEPGLDPLLDADGDLRGRVVVVGRRATGQ